MKDYHVFFDRVKGQMPDSVFPNFPVGGDLEENKRSFQFAWLDGSPAKQKDIDVLLEVSLVSKELKAGLLSPLNVKARKSSFALEDHWSWFSIPILISIVKDKSKEEYIRIAATKKLGAFGFLFSLRQISGVLIDASEPFELRKAVAEVWGKTKSDEGRELLMTVAKLKNSLLGAATFQALSEYGDKKDVTEIIELALQSEHSKIRLEAAYTLSRSQDPEIRKKLIVLLGDPSRKIQSLVATSLGFIKDKKAYPVLIKLFEKESGQNKYWMLSAISFYQKRDSIPLFINALDDRHRSIREMAYEFLQGFDAPEAKEAIQNYKKE